MPHRNRVQRIAVAITSFSLMMCFFALAAITIELDRRHSIANSRSPLYVESQADASFAYRVDNTFIGGKLVGVLELEPVRDDEVPPPGLTEWIEPGSIAVSSSAQKHADVLERQFGPIQAVIDDAVVLEGEHVVYYRPSNGAAFINVARIGEGAYFASGFAGNNGDGALFGDITYEQWSELLLPAALLVFAFPLVLNLRDTRASVSESLARERFILQSIGAPRRELIRHSIRFLLWPYLLGSVVAVVIIVVLAMGLVRLPLTGFQLHSALYIDRSVVLIGYLVLASGAAFAYLLWPSKVSSRNNSTGRRSIGSKTGLFLFGLGAVIATIIGLFFRIIPNELIPPLALTAALLILLGLHATLSVLSTGLTNATMKLGNISLRSALFFRWIINHPYKASRTGAFAGVFVIIGVLLVALFGIVAGAQIPPQNGPADVQIVQTSLNCPKGSDRCLEDALEAIRSQNPTAAVFAAAYGQGFAEVNSGSVDDALLEEFIQYQLVPAYGNQIGELSLESRRAWIYTVSDQNSNLLSEIHGIDFNTAVIPLSIAHGEDGRAIAYIYRQQASWLTLLTTLAFIYAMTSVWFQFSRETNSHAEEFSSIASLTGKADMIARTIAIRNTLINAVTGAFSLGVGIFLALQFFFPLGGFIPWAFIFTVGAFYLAFISAQGILLYRLVRKHANVWLPGRS